MGKKLYVGNLAYGVTNADLEKLFQAHGTVNSAQVICGDAIPTFMPPTSRAGVGPAPHASDRCLLAWERPALRAPRRCL